ncbi:MAG: hypothetical protein ACOYM2_04845 [Rectinemataceae bacterium]
MKAGKVWVCVMVAGLGFLASPLAGQTSYPGWFFHPPAGDSVAVFARSDAEALDSGAVVLATYQQCRLEGDFQRFYSTALRDESYNNTAYYYYATDKDVAVWRNKVKVLASWAIRLLSGEYVFLVGRSQALSAADKAEIAVASLSRPDWTRRGGFIKDGFVYGVGLFSIMGRSSDAWIKCEDNAVFSLVTTYSIQIGSITEVGKNENDKAVDDSMLKIDWVRLKYQLGGLRVLERWIDTSSETCMVLVGAPESSIRSFK